MEYTGECEYMFNFTIEVDEILCREELRFTNGHIKIIFVKKSKLYQIRNLITPFLLIWYEIKKVRKKEG